MNERRCHTCKFSFAHRNEDAPRNVRGEPTKGECRRHPPQAKTGFPIVNLFADWCGEYRQKTGRTK